MAGEPTGSASPFRVWFITGSSGGLGTSIALEALKRGDKVIAASRNVNAVEHLKLQGADVLELDVTSSFERIKEVAAEAERIYGRVDVVVNNSGWPAVSPLEELGGEGLRIQFETNVFGVANVTSAFLPYMRARRDGTVIIMGSRSGWRTKFMTGAYAASKAAIHAYGEALAVEVAPFNVRVTTLVPGGFPTTGINGRPDTNNPATSYPSYSRIEDYIPQHDKWDEYAATLAAGVQSNDPLAFASLVADVVRGEGVMLGKPFPSRLVVGSDAASDIRLKVADIEQTMATYPEVITYTDRRSTEAPQAPTKTQELALTEAQESAV